VTSLPRRLSLDFSDVFNEGLAFDRLSGDFRLDGGSAYTCNLGLEGDVANIGVVGRAGLEARDYEQLAVVRPHMSNVLPISTAVIAGPVAGASMLLISRLFRDRLSSIGESYYTVSGSWDEPVATKIKRSKVNTAPFRDCENELPDISEEQIRALEEFSAINEQLFDQP
jgi:uncharacterized protein YhdP